MPTLKTVLKYTPFQKNFTNKYIYLFFVYSYLKISRLKDIVCFFLKLLLCNKGQHNHSFLEATGRTPLLLLL